VALPYSKALYVGGAAAIVFGPALTFLAALKFGLASPKHATAIIGFVLLVVLPVLLGLARLLGRAHLEAFLQKIEQDAHIGRWPIIALWIAGSLAIVALGLT
jgi:hypothetical protein